MKNQFQIIPAFLPIEVLGDDAPTYLYIKGTDHEDEDKCKLEVKLCKERPEDPLFEGKLALFLSSEVEELKAGDLIFNRKANYDEDPIIKLERDQTVLESNLLFYQGKLLIVDTSIEHQPGDSFFAVLRHWFDKIAEPLAEGDISVPFMKLNPVIEGLIQVLRADDTITPERKEEAIEQIATLAALMDTMGIDNLRHNGFLNHE